MVKKRSSVRRSATSTSGTGSRSSRRGTTGKPTTAKRTARAAGSADDAGQAEIERLDRQLLDLISRRALLTAKQGEQQSLGVAGRMARADRQIAALVAERDDPAGLSAATQADLLRHVASVCLQGVHRARVTYLGPPHSYSHLAAIQFFGDGTLLSPVASIAAVFESVSRHDAHAGVVPIENSTDGRVVDTLGVFVRLRMRICGEVLLAVHHHLLSRTPREGIVEVYSKPQALSQCRGWLANHLPAARLVEISSTAAAAQLAAEKEGAAAVASFEAGRAYGLDVIDSGIEDNPNNVTRFAILGREAPERTGDDKTALLFQVDHQPGALADAMVIFKRHGLNLTWIESFPMPGSQSEYLFFIEAEGHLSDPPMAAAVAALQRRALRLDVLGSYPRGVLVQ